MNNDDIRKANSITDIMLQQPLPYNLQETKEALKKVGIFIDKDKTEKVWCIIANKYTK